jgi:hypothetical protein
LPFRTVSVYYKALALAVFGSLATKQMIMDIHLYFAIALWSLLFSWVLLYGLRRFLPRSRFAFTYFVQIQVPFINKTVLEIGAILIYLAANATALRFEGLSSSKLFAIVNLVLLFLGGRTSLIADSLGISLREYYLAHQWVAIIVVALSVVHLVRTVTSRSFDKLQTISGGVLFVGLCLCLVFSFIQSVANSKAQVSKLPYTLFLNLHRLLSLSILVSLGWHLWSVSTPFSFAWLTVFGTGSLWMFSVGLRLLRWYGYRAAKLTIQSTQEAARLNLTRLTIDTGSTVPALPGTYFYINIPGQHSSVCVPVAWWTDEENESVRHVEVLIGRNIGPLPSNFRFRLGGPYGGDLSMGSFETVVLAAEGIGISGVLPFALSLISRRKHDTENRKREDVPLYCDMTRNIDLFWKLDSNCQYDCAAGYFESLAETLKEIASYSQPQNAVPDNTQPYESQTSYIAPDGRGPGTAPLQEKPRVSLLSVYVAYPDRPDRADIKAPKLPSIKNWHITTDPRTLSERIKKVANGKPGRTLVAGKSSCYKPTSWLGAYLSQHAVPGVSWMIPGPLPFSTAGKKISFGFVS